MVSASVDVQGRQVELLVVESVDEVLIEGGVPGGSGLPRLATDEVVHQVGLGLEHADVVEDLVEIDVPVSSPVSVPAGHLCWHHAVAKPEFYQDKN